MLTDQQIIKQLQADIKRIDKILTLLNRKIHIVEKENAKLRGSISRAHMGIGDINARDR